MPSFICIVKHDLWILSGNFSIIEVGHGEE